MSKRTVELKVTTPAEREARKVFREVEAAKAMTDHEKARPSMIIGSGSKPSGWHERPRS
jgi:hypothetical protein